MSYVRSYCLLSVGSFCYKGNRNAAMYVCSSPKFKVHRVEGPHICAFSAHFKKTLPVNGRGLDRVQPSSTAYIFMYHHIYD